MTFRNNESKAFLSKTVFSTTSNNKKGKKYLTGTHDSFNKCVVSFPLQDVIKRNYFFENIRIVEKNYHRDYHHEGLVHRVLKPSEPKLI